MKLVFTSKVLAMSLQVLLSVSLFTWFVFIGLPAHASTVAPQTSSSTCPVIPAHFDFAHASHQELRRYHIPSPPATSDQRAIARWLKDVQGIKKIVCLPATYSNPVQYHGKPVIESPALVNCANAAAPSGASCSLNWNGWVDGNGAQPGFNDIYAVWNVPCVNKSLSPPGSEVSSWVGLGGNYNGDNLWQGGSAWDSANGYYLWYEAVGANGTPSAEKVISTTCGETVHVEVWFAPGNTSSNVGIDILDVNNYTIYTKYAPSGFHSGNLSGEWIDERPSCGADRNGNPYLYFLADYNYTQWTDAYISPNNASAGYSPIGSFSHKRSWMENDAGQRIAWADVLGSNDGSGTDNYQSHWENSGDYSSLCGGN